MIGLKPRPRGQNGNGIPKRVHLVGAGGIHMSAIGQILLQRGHTVTGSDLTLSEHTERLDLATGAVTVKNGTLNQPTGLDFAPDGSLLVLERDRVRNDIEYDVNLKSEMQIAHMHEKVDENYAAFQQRLDRIERKLDSLAPPPSAQ